MLVLTRKQQEKIQIGDNIVITVLRTKGNTVRLGIEAPKNVSVLRGELADRIGDEASANAESESKVAQPVASMAKHATKAATVDRTQRGQAVWSESEAKELECRVSLDRVGRSRVGSVLPTMLGDAGPLRAMLDRRASSVTA